MIWLDLAVSLALATALLLIPGFLVLVAGGMRGFLALAAAPVISTVIVASAAVIAGAAGWPWGWIPVAGLTVVVVVAAAVFGLVRRRYLRGREELRFPRTGWAWWVAPVVAALLWARHLRNVLGRPDAFSQTFDNIWHLNAIRHMLVTGNASSLTIGELNSSGGGLYPSAFHDLAALVTQNNGGELFVAVNAVAAAVAGVVWPLAVLFLVRACFRPSAPTVIGIGVLAASFPAFPLLYLDFGVLYANLIGLALTPVLIGVVVQLFGLGTDRWLDAPRAVMILLAGVPALLLAHPNALMFLLLVTAAAAMAVAIRIAIRAATTGVSWRAVAGFVAALTVIFVVVSLWPVLRPGTEVEAWPAWHTDAQAFGLALTNAPVGGLANWGVSALMVVGILVARSRGLLWLVGAWAVVVYFWLVVASFPTDEFRVALVGIWYNDFYRFAANLPLLALPLAALGLQHLVDQLETFVGRSPRLRDAWARPVGVAVVSLVVVASLVLVTQRTPAMNAAVSRASDMYALEADSALVDAEEYQLLQELPSVVPEGDMVAVNPWTGAALVYAISGRPATAPHTFYGEDDLRVIVRQSLDEAGTDAAVCPVLEASHVRWALDFGDREVHGGHHYYPGLDALADTRGFVEVLRVGHAALYRIDACD